MSETTPSPEPLTCYNHPQRETMLRCNRCERPICSECAVRTPTGYRCKECLRTQQKVFDTAQTLDYFLAIAISLVLAFAGSLLVAMLGFITILLGPGVGTITAEVVRWAVRRRRSKLLFQLSVGAAVLGCLPVLLISFLSGGLYGLIWPGVYLFSMPSTLYYRLSGIQIR